MLIGLDIGGTKIEICVLDKSGNTLFKHRTPTPHEYELFLSTLCQLVAIAESETQTHCQIGIGLPGAISPATGLIKNANCTFLNGRNLKADLCARLQRNVVIVLGGGLSNVASLYVDLPQATANYVFSDSAQIVFTQAKYGDSSGIRGAAWLGLN